MLATHQHLNCAAAGARLRKCIGNGIKRTRGYRDSRESGRQSAEGFGEIGRFVDPDTDDFLLRESQLTQLNIGRPVMHGNDHDASPNGGRLRSGRRDTGVSGELNTTSVAAS